MKKFVTSVVCTVFLMGCTPSWEYTPRNWKTPENTQKTIQVSQFEDSRPKTPNDTFKFGKLILHWIPFVFKSNITDVEHPEGNVIEMSEMAYALPEATGEEFKATGMFQSVSVMPEKEISTDYTLKGTILNTHSSKTISAYGLSVVGNVISLLGVPSGSVNNSMTVNYQLLDKNKKVVFDKTYTENSSRPIFIYTELSKGQFDILPDVYQNINRRLIKDLHSVVLK